MEVSRLEGEAASISLATEEQYAQYQQLKQVTLVTAHPRCPGMLLPLQPLLSVLHWMLWAWVCIILAFSACVHLCADSVCLPVCLCVCACVCTRVHICRCASMSVHVYLCVSICLCMSVCYGLSVWLCVFPHNAVSAAVPGSSISVPLCLNVASLHTFSLLVLTQKRASLRGNYADRGTSRQMFQTDRWLTVKSPIRLNFKPMSKQEAGD